MGLGQILSHQTECGKSIMAPPNRKYYTTKIGVTVISLPRNMINSLSDLNHQCLGTHARNAPARLDSGLLVELDITDQTT